MDLRYVVPSIQFDRVLRVLLTLRQVPVMECSCCGVVERIGVAGRVQGEGATRENRDFLPISLAGREISQTEIGRDVRGIDASRLRARLSRVVPLLLGVEDLTQDDPSGGIIRVELDGVAQVLLGL